MIGMSFFFILMVACAVGGIGCSVSSPTNTATVEDLVFDARVYFPLDPGTVYHYEETSDEGVEEKKYIVNAPATVEGISRTVSSISAYDGDGELGEIAYYAVDSIRGLLCLGEDEVQDDITERMDPGFCIPNGIAVGAKIDQTVGVTIEGDTEKADTDAEIAEFTLTFEGFESITIPAGTFEDCAVFLIKEIWKNGSGEILSDGLKRLYLAPYVGMVKEVDDLNLPGEEETMVLTDMTAEDDTL